MWVQELPENLRLLSLLNPSHVQVDNLPTHLSNRASPQPALPKGKSLSREEREHWRDYKKSLGAALRNGSHRSTSSRGGQREVSLSSEDLMGALTRMNVLHQYFGLGMAGLLKTDALLEFERLVYFEGLVRENSFVRLAFDDFVTVFRCAWYDLMTPCDKQGNPRIEIGTRNNLARVLGCGRVKADRLIRVYDDAASILLGLALGVSEQFYKESRTEA